MMSALEKRVGNTRPVDRYATRVDRMEPIGDGMVRVTYLVTITDEEDGKTVLAPADFALVVPLAAIADGIGKAMMALGRTVIAREGEILVRH